jgi:uncharacterized membrane protein
MKNAKEPRAVTVHELRHFAVTVALSIGVIAGVIVPAFRRREFPFWPWIVAALIVVLAILVPQSLRGFRSLSHQVRDRVAAIQTRVVLTVVYFLIIVPLGLIMQLSQKRDRKRQNATTYRLLSVTRSKASLEKPF